MKNLIFICLLTLVTIPSFAQTNDSKAPKFKFDAKEVDFGTIERDSEGIVSYTFTNVGKSPLIISKVTGSCGCTVPSTPKEPIMPGQKGEIKVKYDTHRVGKISKSITIISNADRPSITVSVRGLVKPKSALSLLEKKEKSMIQEK
ncbi:DUF1573 domain-containing protein [Flavobacteriaceae bacterium F08102]|nr:DUF1573 domain-containing protein [Flavobacteriaceae bacterium F08102]